MSKHGPIPLTHSLPRNPWSGRGESVSSSASSQPYQAVAQLPLNQYIQVESGPGYWAPVPPPPPLLSHLLPPPQHRLSTHEHHSRGTSSRAASPQSSPETLVLPCGGHCVLLEQFCHRFLQVAFAGGVLSGCILTGAGLLGSPEVGVLAYIGGLTALVSGLLLAVQSRSSRPRRRHHRQPHREEIPLRQVLTQPPDLFREESGIPWWRRENLD